MSIEVTCPNGHRFKVKDRWAGKSGRCPKCKAAMTVPVPAANVSDDDALAMIGDYDTPPPKPALVIEKTSGEKDDEVAAAQSEDDYEEQLDLATSGMGVLGAGVTSGKHVCENCGKEASEWSASCGHCGAYFDGRK